MIFENMGTETQMEMHDIQQLIKEIHTEILEVNKKFLELAVRVNNLSDCLKQNR